MFERYTERARRAIFFGRYEASAFGSDEIGTQELLLGLFRDDKTGATGLAVETTNAIRKEIESMAPSDRPKVPTSVDLPLSLECTRALTFAAEEADSLNAKSIDTPHLLLGLLRVETGSAAELLRKHGVEYESYRKLLADSAAKPKIVTQPEPFGPRSTTLNRQALELSRLVDNLSDRTPLGEDDGEQMLRRKPWSRLEAIGHLIDWAAAHHQWLVQVLLESKVTAASYPSEDANIIQRYFGFSWAGAVDLWVSLNRFIVHMLHNIPEDKAQAQCRIGISPPILLTELMDHYIEHCEDILGQILAHL